MAIVIILKNNGKLVMDIITVITNIIKNKEKLEENEKVISKEGV